MANLLTVVLYYVFSYLFSFQSQPGLRLDFLDVGQGDSLLITTPNNRYVLVDGGGDFELDYKLSRKIPFPFCNLDMVFLTHSHADHYSGLARVFQRCSVGQFTFNDIECVSKSCKKVAGIIPLKKVYRGDSFVIDGVTIKVLWPPREKSNTDWSDVNDSSTILLIDYGSFEALLAGDASAKVLESLDLPGIFSLVQGKLDIYKVSHHGSKTGLAQHFLTQLQPENCVISAGIGNSFGHPHQEVIDFLSKVGCHLYRTDLQGDVSFVLK